MALDAAITVKEIPGDSKKAGHPKGSSIVHAVYHSLDTPVDEAHGSVTHRRQHGLMTVEILIDSSSYGYYDFVKTKDTDGSKKLDVTLSFYRTNQDNIGLWGAGETKPYFTIHMTEAFVATVEFVQDDTRASGGAGHAAGGRGEYLRVKFAYRQIEWTWMNGNKTTLDAWDK